MSTTGELRVRPREDDNTQVNLIRVKIAEVIDFVEAHGNDPRLTAIAITTLEEACMWAVKSATAD